ncbi:MAG: Nucleolar protein 58 [Sarcosagium campestre]|nr:MAG: Nucleolar protein 58 [Sarcosagium campestre]
MTLLILTETSAGYALFKAKDKKLLKREDLAAETEDAQGICSLLKLKHFQKFDNAASALEEVTAIVDGKVTPLLSSMLDSLKDEKKVSLAVADPKLGNAINKLPSLSITPISDSTTTDLYRAIRNHLPDLIPGLLPQDISSMSLGLSHSLSRHKLKFSPDKVDTMIVQAIALLDDLDKELNTYAMRVKEWYGWHFPEMGRIVNDNVAYARVILKMGFRSNAATSDLADILPEEIEGAVKGAAEVSMGTEITDEDLENIKALAEQVVGFTEYRQQLSGYLSARMAAIAPNLTVLVGELVGARLIAHAGSLMNLAKSPASTVQILGAEKALFRALKTKHDTPKYGLIYHASLIGQATGRNKGKIARMLATKSTLGLRVDALADWSAEGEGKGDSVPEDERTALGIESRGKIEKRLRHLEGKPLLSKGVSIGPNNSLATQPGKWAVKEARKYNRDADGLTGDEPAALAPTRDLEEQIIKATIVDAQGDVAMVQEPGRASKLDDSEDSDDEADGDDESEAEPSPLPANKSAKNMSKLDTNGTKHDTPDHSDTLPSVSEDSPDSRQSSILGNSKEAKKARKKERHERKLATSEERSKQKQEKNEKLARRLDRRERRTKKQAQLDTREEKELAEYGSQARKAGLSVTRYRRKLERGEIIFTADGTPVAVSKKDSKKSKKSGSAGDEADGADKSSAKKRKRDEDHKSEKGDRSERKKKKKLKHAE